MSLKAPPHYVLFDLDGTLLDSLPGIEHSVCHACGTVGVPAPGGDLRSLLGPPIRSIFATAVRTEDADLLDRLEAAFRANYDTEGWQRTSCFAGAREALEALSAHGCRLFVVSNKPLHISLKILKREGLFPLFESIYTRDSREPAYGSKAEMVQALLHDYSVPASECLLVGDTAEDVEASRANGVAVAIMEHGYGAIPTDVHLEYRARTFSEFLYCEEMGDVR